MFSDAIGAGRSQTYHNIIQNQGLFDNSILEINEKFKQPMSKEEIEKLVEEKFVLIADLFQKLELFHPFPDGQGRTDIILLGKLLSENGFNPAILDEPFIPSSLASLPKWTEYLKEGSKKWQRALLEGT